MRAIAFVVALSIVLLSTVALAGVPGLMNYQGTLTDDAGVALDTTVAMTFSIYNDSTGGAQIWTETQLAVAVSSGLFNVLLGSANAIPDTVFNEPDRWLGIQVGGDAELAPRQRIASVGYAFVSGSSAASSDGDWTISGDDIYSAVSGNVGIGITTPAAKLDVSGVVNTDSVFSIDGTTVLSVEGPYNTFVGEDAGVNVDDGYCTIVGYQAGYNATGYGYNTFVGYQAGYNDQSMRNTFIGHAAGYANTSGLGNAFVGYHAGDNNTSGGNNTFLGYQAGSGNSTGGSNTFLGMNAGLSNSTGGSNTFVGEGAGLSNEVSYNTFVGWMAGYDNTTGNENTFLGRMAGWRNTTGSDNTFLGVDAGFQNTEGYSNTFVGMEAGHDNTTGYGNAALGLQAGYNNSTGNYNVFLGYKAGYNETGSEKLYIANGPDTSDVLIHGDFNTGMVGIGLVDPFTELDVDGSINIDGSYYIDSIAVLRTPSIPPIEYGNTFIGKFAGKAMIPQPARGTMVGYAAGKNNEGGDNTFIGSSAGNANTTGGSNTFLGSYAGYSNTTGAGNVFLGYRAGYSSVSDSNKLYIANSSTIDPLIYGDFDSSFVNIGGKLSVGSSTLDEPFYYFEVTGDAAVTGATITEDLIVLDAVESDLLVNGSIRTEYVDADSAELNSPIDCPGLPTVLLWRNVIVDVDDYNLGVPVVASKYLKNNKTLSKDFRRILDVTPKSGLDKKSGVEVAGIYADDLDAMGLTELVTYYDGEPGYPKYDLITVYMLEIMKEQVKEIEDLRAEVESLKRQIPGLDRQSRE
jgi:hypothetical protein